MKVPKAKDLIVSYDIDGSLKDIYRIVSCSVLNHSPSFHLAWTEIFVLGSWKDGKFMKIPNDTLDNKFTLPPDSTYTYQILEESDIEKLLDKEVEEFGVTCRAIELYKRLYENR